MMGQANKMYDWVMLQVRESIFNDQGIQAVLGKIRSADDPVAGIGHTAAMLIRSVVSGAKEKGASVPKEVLSAAFKETVGDLVELAVAAKVIGEEQKVQVAQVAMKQGAGFFQKTPQKPTGLIQQARGA